MDAATARASAPRANTFQAGRTRTVLVLRAWALAATAVLLGATGHSLAGGHMPHPLLLIFCIALGALGSLGILVGANYCIKRMPRALALGNILGALGIQGLLHAVFSFSHTAHRSDRVDAALAGRHLHGMHAQTLDMPRESMVVPSHHDTAMLGVHLVAAVATLGVYYTGERAITTVLEALTVRVRTLLPLWPVIPALRCAPLTASEIIYIQPSFTDRLLAHCRIERGPPYLRYTYR